MSSSCDLILLLVAAHCFIYLLRGLSGKSIFFLVYRFWHSVTNSCHLICLYVCLWSSIVQLWVKVLWFLQPFKYFPFYHMHVCMCVCETYSSRWYTPFYFVKVYFSLNYVHCVCAGVCTCTSGWELSTSICMVSTCFNHRAISPADIFFPFLFVLDEGLTLQPWLFWNSPASNSQKSSCFWVPSVGIWF